MSRIRKILAALGLVKKPPATVTSTETKPHRAALAVVLLAPFADPASCRVTMRPTDWSEVRVMAPASGPFTSLAVELCVTFEQTVSLENLWVFGGTRWHVRDLAIEIEASFDPLFAPGFALIPPTVIALPDVAGSVGPFDGTFDFGGTSGEAIPQSTSALVTATLAVADPTFFLSPWPVYLRTRTLPYTQTSGSPAMVFTSTASAGGGLVVTYVP